ncbi:MAG: COQ9 family protein [Pseudomonadota bacterium]
MTDTGETGTGETGTGETRTEGLDDLRARLVAAALPHVPFDGWSSATLAAAAADEDVDLATARSVFPRGGVDMALAFHYAGDRDLAEALASGGLAHLRYSERVAHAVRRRLEMADPHKEAVRRSTSLFALPIYTGEGARAIWHTADTIWKGLGDSATDYNWYTKRMTLSGVISATLLFWLGDTSAGNARSWDFLDRRIADVMRIESMRATIERNPVGRAMMAGPKALLSVIRAPGAPRTPPGSRWPRWPFGFGQASPAGGPGPGDMPDKIDPQ